MIEQNPAWVAMTSVEQKAVMLSEMIRFDGFCRERGLDYFLDAGTLLGAVRHKGFIPWDDDVDLGLPRESYDSLHAFARGHEGYIAPHLKVETPAEILYPSSKASDDRTVLIEFPDKNPMKSAVYMDIFPQDGLEGNGLTSRLLCWQMRMCGLAQWFCKYSVDAWKGSDSGLKRAVAAFGRRTIKGSNFAPKLQNLIIRHHNRRHPLQRCDYFTTLVNGEFDKRAPIRCIEEFIEGDFEGHKFMIPIGYDKYLRCLYPGDYMVIPPKEKRVWHQTQIFWKSEDAKEDFYKTESRLVDEMQASCKRWEGI